MFLAPTRSVLPSDSSNLKWSEWLVFPTNFWISASFNFDILNLGRIFSCHTPDTGPIEHSKIKVIKEIIITKINDDDDVDNDDFLPFSIFEYDLVDEPWTLVSMISVWWSCDYNGLTKITIHCLSWLVLGSRCLSHECIDIWDRK